MTDDEIIDRILIIRRQNNVPWMEIVRIAMRAAPEETRKVLQSIYANDLSVAKHVRELIGNERDG